MQEEIQDQGRKTVSCPSGTSAVQMHRRKRRKSMRLMSSSTGTGNKNNRSLLDQYHHGEDNTTIRVTHDAPLVAPPIHLQVQQQHSPFNMVGLLQSRSQSFPSPVFAMTSTRQHSHSPPKTVLPMIPGVLRRRYRYPKQQPQQQQLKHFTGTSLSSSSSPSTGMIESFVKKPAQVQEPGETSSTITFPDFYSISQSSNTETDIDIEEDNMHQNQTGQSQSVSVSRSFPTPEERTAASKKLFGFLVEEDERLKLEVSPVILFLF
jgi:hypothetical protein